MAKLYRIRSLSASAKGTQVTTQPCYCEPFFGEAISEFIRLNGPLGDCFVAKDAPRNEIPNSFDAELNSYGAQNKKGEPPPQAHPIAPLLPQAKGILCLERFKILNIQD